jgi:hypothetical protein
MADDPRKLAVRPIVNNYLDSQQDRFRTHELKRGRESNIIEQFLWKMYNPTDPGIGPMAMEAPIAAMIPTVRNLPVFQKLVQEAIQKISDNHPFANQAFKDALGFAQTRYPRLTGIPEAFNPVSNYIGNPEKTMVGRYMPSIKQALITQKTAAGDEAVKDIVDTIVHESRHALSDRRTPQILYNEVLDNLEEKNAYRAGATGKVAYRKYQELVNKSLKK